MRRNLLLLLLIFVVWFWEIIHLRLYFNIFSSSVPVGIYRRVDDAPKTGSFAATCLDRSLAEFGLERGYLIRGNCKTGIQPVLKIIYAVEGDTFAVHDGLVVINGKKLTGFDVLDTDSKGRAVKPFFVGEHTLKKDEFILMSDHKKNSWDSRYWGPVPVEYLLEPVWTRHE